MPNTRPVNDSALVTEFVLRRAAEANLCRVFPAGAITRGQAGEEMAEIGELAGAGCVCVTDDGRPVMKAGLMRRVLQYARAFRVPVMVHEEDLTLSSKGLMNEGATATRLGLLPIPTSAEVAMVARDLVLCEETGGRLHLAHLSCADSVRLVREAKRRGLAVTAEAAPHHFTLTDEAVAGYDTHAKMNPPLRQRRRRGGGPRGPGRRHHRRHRHRPRAARPVEKDVEFDEAANGIVGLETALPLGAGARPLGRALALAPRRADELWPGAGVRVAARRTSRPARRPTSR